MKNLLKIKNCKLKIGDFRRGMTYVELIVVLSIFAVMTSLVLFNYGEFQAKVDIKNLASDIALKIVEAQKSAVAGELSTQSFSTKPAYGVYFNSSVSTDSDGVPFNKKFIFFADFDNNGIPDITSGSCAGECLDKLIIPKNDFISGFEVVYMDTSIDTEVFTDLSVAFKRPNSAPVITSSATWWTSVTSPINYVQINISSPTGENAKIRAYASGRIQIN